MHYFSLHDDTNLGLYHRYISSLHLHHSLTHTTHTCDRVTGGWRDSALVGCCADVGFGYFPYSLWKEPCCLAIESVRQSVRMSLKCVNKVEINLNVFFVLNIESYPIQQFQIVWIHQHPTKKLENSVKKTFTIALQTFKFTNL